MKNNNSQNRGPESVAGRDGRTPFRAPSDGLVVDLRAIRSQAPDKKKTAGHKAAARLRPDLLAAASRSGLDFRLPSFCRPRFSFRRFFRQPSLDFRRWRPRFRLASRRRNSWPEMIRAQAAAFDLLPSLKRRGFRSFFHRAHKHPYWQAAASFVGILLLLIVPVKILSHFSLFDFNNWKDGVMRRSQLAVNSLMAAADSATKLDWQAADVNFQTAGQNFSAAKSDLDQINDSLLALAALSNDPRLKLAAESKKFLAAGVVASSLGRNLVLATESLLSDEQKDFRAALDNFINYGRAASRDAAELKKQLAAIDPANLPVEYQARFTGLEQQAAVLGDGLDGFVSSADRLKEVLGLSRDKRYLLVFQNNAELRASGGFLGSYALLDIRNGRIQNLEVPEGGTYDTEAGMKNWRVVAPRPLWLVNPLWNFWDANWWPDWPMTARNLMLFYAKSGGPTVDGVISLTPTVMEKLLEITGPIDMQAEYGVIISADNFWETVQKITEQNNLAKTHPEVVAALPAADGKPKKIIGDLADKMLAVLPQKLNADNFLKILSVFDESVAGKHVMLYFSDGSLEQEIVSRHWGGEMKETDRDYLMVVNTNIAGQKTDRLIKEDIEQVSEVAADGTITNTVTITRAHQGIKNEPLTGVRNVDWLRVYVPRGSELLEASGFQSPDEEYLQDRPEADWSELPELAAENNALVQPESGTKVYEENQKTVFANWTMVDPGQTATIVLRYRLPFNFFTATGVKSDWFTRLDSWLNPGSHEFLSYSLLVQKQPGAAASGFKSRLFLPPGQEILWRYPETLSGPTGWETADSLDRDKYLAILLRKQ